MGYKENITGDWQRKFKIGDLVVILPDEFANGGIYESLEIGQTGTVSRNDQTGLYVQFDKGVNALMFKREVGLPDDPEWMDQVNAALINRVQDE